MTKLTRRRRSSSCNHSSCVEVEALPEGWVAVRDSKDPDGPHLQFNPTEWAAFLARVRAGEFDPPSPTHGG